MRAISCPVVVSQTRAVLSSLPAAAQSVTSVANLILCLRLNFVAMGDLLNSIQGSLAMFTGGQGQAAYPELDALRTMGGFTLAASFNEGVLSVQTHYEAPAKQVAQK